MKSFKSLTLELFEGVIGTSDHLKSYHRSDEGSKFITSEGNKIHSKYNATPDEINALGNYARNGYNNINKFHRHGEEHIKNSVYSYRLPDIKKESGHLDSLIGNHKTEHDLHVWRGITHTAAESIGLGKSDIVSDKGYVSTSLDPSRSHRFISGHVGENHIMHIKVPKGSKALYVPKYNHITQEEHEVLLPRNSKFKHEGSTEHSIHGINITVHHLTHIPE